MITFVTPFILLLLLLLPALWALALLPHGASARPKTWRVWASVCARTLAFGALTGALAGAQLAWPARDLTVIFLLDRSDSVTPDQRGHAEAFVRQALAVLPPGDRAGLVVFGQQALVERLPSGDRALGAIAALPGGARSNLADAIRLALGLLPPSGQRRLVLLSDGGAGGDSAE